MLAFHLHPRGFETRRVRNRQQTCESREWPSALRITGIHGSHAIHQHRLRGLRRTGRGL